MCKTIISLTAIITFGFFMTTVQVFAKDLGNGWTDQDFKKHYNGCIKGAVTTHLKTLVKKRKITRETSKEERDAIVDKLIDRYAPVCKCIQNSIVEKVDIKDIKNIQKDKTFVHNISQACVKQHLK